MVDLGDLVESLKREVSPPGTDLYPDATDDRWLGDLSDAFWEAVLQGAITGYTVDDNGIVTQISGTTDLPREVQQLLVLYAGYRVLLTSLQNTNTVFRATAGPVSFEQQKSAQALQAVLKSLTDRLKISVAGLRSSSVVTSAVFDSVIERNCSYAHGAGYWVR